MPSSSPEHLAPSVDPVRGTAVPNFWQTALHPQLADGEQVVFWLEIDLNRQLRFSRGLLVLTGQRLLTLTMDDSSLQAWDYRTGIQLKRRDHAGVGTLELLDETGLLAVWRYTIGLSATVRQFMSHFDQQQQARLTGQPVPQRPEGVCPSCGAILAPDQDECPACAEVHTPPSTWALLRLWRFAKPRAWAILAGFLMTLTATAANLVPPYLTMPLMDKVLIPFQNGVPIDYTLVAWYLTGLGGAAVLAWLLTWGRTFILAWVSERIGGDLRTATYEHLQRLSLEFFGGKRTGDLIARIGSETDRICTFLSLHALDFATDVLLIVMTSVILVSIDPWLALVTLAPLPIIAWMINSVRDRLRHGFEQSNRTWSEITNVLADTIPGIRVVKAFAQEGREVQRFRRANDHVLAVNDRVNTIWSFFGPVVTLLTELGLLIVWMFGIWRVSQSAITVGVLAAFLTYISRFYTRLDSMSRIISVTQRAAAGAQRLFDILDRVPSVPEPQQPVHPGRVKGEIALHEVGFRYGNRTVLQGLNLHIRPGELIGLVGPSGSGKSTLVNLVCRFYDVAEGAIRVDGTDIRSFPVSEYRRNIGLVLQEPFLFFGSIAENIAYGRPEATREDIVAAARAAHAHEFILRLPEGYDSLVGERGQSLSGGERQRISIARALLIDPQILILDEATSAVDTETELEIQQALDYLVQGRTTIAIAHRLSTLRRADRLVVLEDGRVVEEGQHDVLLAANGAYARLYQAQAELADAGSADDEGALQRVCVEIKAATN